MVDPIESLRCPKCGGPLYKPRDPFRAKFSIPKNDGKLINVDEGYDYSAYCTDCGYMVPGRLVPKNGKLVEDLTEKR